MLKTNFSYILVTNGDEKGQNIFVKDWGKVLKKWQIDKFWQLHKLYGRFGQLAMNPIGEEYLAVKKMIQESLDMLMPDWE